MSDFTDAVSNLWDTRVSQPVDNFLNNPLGSTSTTATPVGAPVSAPVAPVSNIPQTAAPDQTAPRGIPQGQTMNLANSAGPAVPIQPPVQAPVNQPPVQAPVLPTQSTLINPAINPEAMGGDVFNRQTGAQMTPEQVAASNKGLYTNGRLPQPGNGTVFFSSAEAQRQAQASGKVGGYDLVNNSVEPTNPTGPTGNQPPVNQVSPLTAPTAPAAPGFGLKLPEGHTEQHYSDLNSNDPQKLSNLAFNPGTPPAVQKDALERLHSDLDYRNKVDKAMALGDKYMQTGDVNGITREMNKKGDEGSYLKAYLFARLGLTDLAAKEQEKINPTRTTMPIMIGNDHYSAVYGKDGELVSARDETGRQVDDATLAKLAANGFASKGAVTGNTFMRDTKTGNIWSHTTTPGTNRVVWTNQTTGAVSTTAPSSLSTISGVNPATKANIAIAQAQIKKMESDNIEAARTNSTPPHSQESINALREIINGTGEYAGPTTPAGNVPSNIAATTVNASNGPSGATTQTTMPSEIPNKLKSAIIGQESGGRQTNAQGQTLTSVDNAKGIGQILPETWKGYVDRGLIPKNWSIDNAEQNRAASGIIIDDLLKQYNGDTTKTAAAYFGGPGAVNKDGSINYDRKDGNGVTVRQYVDNVNNRMGATPVTTTEPIMTTGKWATPEANALAARNPTAESIAEYKTKPPASSGRSGASAAAIMNDVRKINPNFDETKYKVAQEERDGYTKVSPTTSGGQLQAINRAVPHLEQYKRAVDALNNNDMPLFNKIANQYQLNVGNDKVAGAKAIQALVSTEVQKAVAGGLGGVEERKDLAGQMSTSLNPKQLANVIDQYQGLMAAQGTGLKQKWTANGLPASEWDAKLVPAARDAMMKHEKKENNQRSKW
jgi:soluble lytic murein transglycosylase-like protein